MTNLVHLIGSRLRENISCILEDYTLKWLEVIYKWSRLQWRRLLVTFFTKVKQRLKETLWGLRKPLMKTTQVIKKGLKSHQILHPALTSCTAPHRGQTSAPRLKRQSMENCEVLVHVSHSSQKPGRCTSNNSNFLKTSIYTPAVLKVIHFTI